ncbi:TPA: hypothetical protein QC443_005833 [Bacillus cereus]|uniref:hypothetical protein n=1 Tax=Bacillus cereus TaxID=1396 RepID=UPI0019276950|nr:hypothetical protein [Bacillus cereus]MBL3878135.1 hypothetical protein [Bacillus cereus]HDR7977704.1 hypothetical protein [Bacillus cereus]HDR8060713.1 hypothetical protein [Bacillus cereus]HDR8078178.1 hypothetical protein [Bacillus cereus]HDR8209064.1 hypothetical protein [Bacillus cereus]
MINIVSNQTAHKKTNKHQQFKTQPKVSLTAKTASIFYWNLKRKDLSGEIKELVSRSPFDILFFSETTQRTRKALDEVLRPMGYTSRTQLSGNVRVALFEKYQQSEIVMIKEERRFTMIIYNFGGENYMVVGVHLDSPVSYPDEADRYVVAKDVYSIIAFYSEYYKVNNTVVIGDFNMNPFDRGMVSELSFKATHCKQTAQTINKGKDYFFNPSWKIFSNDLTEAEKKPPGTIHYVPRNKDTYVDYWHVFDQVLISPYMISEYSNSYEVLTEWNKVKLLDASLIPDRTNFSDHLPIIYTIKIK